MKFVRAGCVVAVFSGPVVDLHIRANNDVNSPPSPVDDAVATGCALSAQELCVSEALDLKALQRFSSQIQTWGALDVRELGSIVGDESALPVVMCLAAKSVRRENAVTQLHHVLLRSCQSNTPIAFGGSCGGTEFPCACVCRGL